MVNREVMYTIIKSTTQLTNIKHTLILIIHHLGFVCKTAELKNTFHIHGAHWKFLNIKRPQDWRGNKTNS